MSWAVALGAAVSFTLAAPSSAADAEGAAPAAEKLVAAAKSRLWICNLYARAALAHLDAGRESEAQSALEELLSKIKESKESFSESYVAARTRLAGGNKKATEALNDYASSVLAAYDESAIRTGETQATYERRTVDLESELSAKADIFRQRVPAATAQAAAPAVAVASARSPVLPPVQTSAQPSAQASVLPSAQVTALPPAQVTAAQASAKPVQAPAKAPE